MERNYFIRKDYSPLKETDKFDIQYWENNYRDTIKPFVNQYDVYKFSRKLLVKHKLESVLDIGCRDGKKLMKLIYPKCHDVIGVDLEPYFIEYANRKYGLNKLYIDDIENPKIDLKKIFDLIICSDVIEHLIDPDKLLFYIKKYSNQNTYIVISTPERILLYGYDRDTPQKTGHIREWDKFEFLKYLRNSGFQIISYKLIYHTKLSYLIKKLFFSIKKSMWRNYFDLRLLFKILFIKNSKERKRFKSTQVVLCKLKV